MAVPPFRVTVLEVVSVVTDAEPPDTLVDVVAVAALPPMLNADAVPVMFVPTNAEGVPRAGVTSVGDVDITTLPVPVIALLTNWSDPFVNTAWLAVKAVKVTVPEAVKAAKSPVLPPSTFCQAVPLKMIQSPTPHSVWLSMLVDPATLTT